MKKLIKFIGTSPTEHECIKFLELIYWNSVPISPFDKTSKVYITKRGYRCKNTSKYFNVRNNTLFADTKTPLIHWLQSIVIVHSGNVSSYMLAKHLGIGQKSAWFILNRINHENLKLAQFIQLIV